MPGGCAYSGSGCPDPSNVSDSSLSVDRRWKASLQGAIIYAQRRTAAFRIGTRSQQVRQLWIVRQFARSTISAVCRCKRSVRDCARWVRPGSVGWRVATSGAAGVHGRGHVQQRPAEGHGQMLRRACKLNISTLSLQFAASNALTGRRLLVGPARHLQCGLW